MNDGFKAHGALKSAEQSRIGDKCEKVSIRRGRCTNGVVRSRGMGYEKC